MAKTRIAKNALNSQGAIRSANLNKNHYQTKDHNAIKKQSQEEMLANFKRKTAKKNKKED